MTLRPWLRRVFVENAYYKFFSLALVVLLYIWVMGDRDSEVTLNTTLRLAVPEGMVLVNQPRKEVELTLSGRWTALERLSASNNLPPLLVDLEDAVSGNQVLRLDEGMVQLPPALRVTSIDPSFISIELQPRKEKRVSISPRFIGELPQGYQLGRVKVVPSTTTINGPADLLVAIEEIDTEAIDLSSKRQDFAAQLRLQHSSPLVRDDLKELVQVSVAVESLQLDRTFEALPVVAVNTTLATTIQPETVSVTLRGPKEVLERLEADTLLATLDLSVEDTRPDGLFQKQVQITNLPPDVELVTHYPTDFQVRTARGEDAPLVAQP